MRFATLRSTCALVAAAFLVSGCSCTPQVTPPETSRPEPPEATETVEPQQPEGAGVLVYLLRGEYLGVAKRTVEPSQDAVVLLRAAMDALVAGPNEDERAWGLGTVIPEDTRCLGVELEDGLATVDLSAEYDTGGGSLSMLLRVAQVVFTATQFEGVETVAFKIDGRPVEAIGGEGIMVSPAVRRADFEGQAPAILVESPAPGEHVFSPLRLWGSANVFEAQFSMRVVDGNGEIITEVPITATSGTGTRGTFAEDVQFPPADTDEGKVVVFEYSAKDGEPIHMVEIPVRLR